MCNKVIRKHLGAVTLDHSHGERLRHTVTLKKGSKGLFSIVDNVSSTAILTSNDPPGIAGPWIREWPQAGDPVNGDTLQGILLQFVQAKSYTWRVDRLNAAGNIVETPVDADYADPKVCFDTINVDIK